MALNWEWSDKMGEVVQLGANGKEWTYNIYGGNALAIIIAEWTEDGSEKYMLHNFFADEAHAKRCLGIDKKWETYGENMFEGDYVRWRLNAKHPKAIKLAKLLVQAYKNVTIELYTEEE